MNYLSKSDYKVGHDCPTKLYYKKMKYPSQMDADEYLIFLAKGGYAVGKMATLYFPEGIEVTAGDPKEAIEITEKYLKLENVTLFEAAILADHKLIRVDILRKKGKNIDLIEVKSKSFDSTKTDELSGSDFKDYLFDIGFQYLTAKERFPDCNITPYLYMPDKSKYTKIDGLSFMFTIKDVPTNTRFRKYEVEVEKSLIAQITKENILTMVNVKGIIDNYIPTIKKELELLLQSIKSDLIRNDTPLSKKCFKCEYSCEEKSGYEECWQNMPKPKYHIKDISRFGNTKAVRAIDDLISQQRITYDEFFKLLGDSKSDQRRKIQIENTLANKVYFSPELSKTIKSYKYPLHFIDFETTRVAIPFHDNMRPYEQLIFQWSCHTIKRPGDEPIHSEWLNLRTEYPNFLFAESLMKQLGNNGTVFIWSPFENTALKDIYKQMIRKEYNNPELKQWLENIIRFKQAKEENPIIPASVCGREGRFTDLHELTKNYYFHPSMNGKTSIKKVLPAVLQDVNSKRILSWLKNYEPGISLLAKDQNNCIIDPYQNLPPFKIYNEAEKIFEEDEDNVINEGTGAMTAYQDIMIGLNKGKPDIIKEYEIALKRYCKLDTLAMVIIWEYWSNYK